MSHFVVMRKANIQEDEGRDHFIKIYSDGYKADRWIAKQKGYFWPEHYYRVSSWEVQKIRLERESLNDSRLD